jgi:hypothetical protein
MIAKHLGDRAERLFAIMSSPWRAQRTSPVDLRQLESLACGHAVQGKRSGSWIDG